METEEILEIFELCGDSMSQYLKYMCDISLSDISDLLFDITDAEKVILQGSIKNSLK